MLADQAEPGGTGGKPSLRRVLRTVLIIACLCVAAYSGYQLFTELREYHVGDAEYQKIAEYVKTGSGSASVPVAAAGNEKSTFDVTFPDVDIDALKKENSDFVGWLLCEDTRINYPVVQAEDDDYYLHRTFEKTPNSAGCLFLECQNAPDFSDPNSIIYGHHMKNGSMFHDLEKYKDADFAKEHPYMLFITPDMKYVVQIFAGFVSDTYSDAWKISFQDGADKQAWLDDLVKNSCFSSGVTPTADDHILTMSTCSYEFDDARFVLYGVLTPVESAEK